MKKKEFVRALLSKLDDIDKTIGHLKKEEEECLRSHPGENKWNALECVEHLVKYNDFYLKEIRLALNRARDSSDEDLRRGWFGKKSADGMLPKEDKALNKMKTFKSKNTYRSGIGREILILFEEQQSELRKLVETSLNKDIGSVKCKTTLPMVKFRLGDIMEFLINHQIRHTHQAMHTLRDVKDMMEA